MSPFSSRMWLCLGMLRYLGFILLVTFITLVVWIFAEAASVQTREFPAADVTFVGEEGQYIRVVDNQNWHDTLDVVVEGSSAELDEAERALRKVKIAPGQGGIPTEPGEYTVDLRQALRAAAGLPAKGVTIARVNPATVRVEVDKMVARTASIRVDVPDVELDGPAEAKPDAAQVLLPSRVAAATPDGLTLVATPEASRIKALVAGRRETLSNVALRLPAGITGAKVQPELIEIAFRIKAKQAVVTLKTVPVLVRLAPRELGKFEVEINEADQFLRDVRVTGPADLVGQVERGEFRIAATLSLSFEELERGINSKQVTFADFPGSLNIEVANPLVRLTVRRRK